MTRAVKYRRYEYVGELALDALRTVVEWMELQRRQYILNMRKTLYYMHRRFFVEEPVMHVIQPILPGHETGALSRRWRWQQEYRRTRSEAWINLYTTRRLRGPGY